MSDDFIGAEEMLQRGFRQAALATSVRVLRAALSPLGEYLQCSSASAASSKCDTLKEANAALMICSRSPLSANEKHINALVSGFDLVILETPAMHAASQTPPSNPTGSLGGWCYARHALGGSPPPATVEAMTKSWGGRYNFAKSFAALHESKPPSVLDSMKSGPRKAI